MTTDVFSVWLDRFDRKMRRQERHMVILLDNCSSHPKDISLTNVKLVYLPPNTTSHLQPLDAGIISIVKRGYKRRFLQAILRRSDGDSSMTSKEAVSTVTLLDTIRWLTASLREIKPGEILNTFIT